MEGKIDDRRRQGGNKRGRKRVEGKEAVGQTDGEVDKEGKMER